VLKNQILRKSIQWESDGWTDRHNEANNTFLQFFEMHLKPGNYFKL